MCFMLFMSTKAPFAVGDEHFRTEDSNHYGPVSCVYELPHPTNYNITYTFLILKIPLGLVESRVEFILWPPNRIGLVLSKSSIPDKRMPHSRAWQTQLDDFNREMHRRARVKEAASST